MLPSYKLGCWARLADLPLCGVLTCSKMCWAGCQDPCILSFGPSGCQAIQSGGAHLPLIEDHCADHKAIRLQHAPAATAAPPLTGQRSAQHAFWHLKQGRQESELQCWHPAQARPVLRWQNWQRARYSPTHIRLCFRKHARQCLNASPESHSSAQGPVAIYSKLLRPVHLDHYLQQTCILLISSIMSSRAIIDAQPTGGCQRVH